MKMSTVALIIGIDTGSPVLLDTLNDVDEIEYIELALKSGEDDPLHEIYKFRERQQKQEEDFGNYIEDLLSQPFVNPQLQKHGVQWLRSRIKIDQFQRTEREAVEVISNYAYKIFEKDPSKMDFFLVSATSQVRIRIFTLEQAEGTQKTG